MQKKQIVIDKRTLEVILNDQKSEMEAWTDEFLCSRNEESLVDLGSPQAQVVIGVRRCGKSTLCMQTSVFTLNELSQENFVVRLNHPSRRVIRIHTEYPGCYKN